MDLLVVPTWLEKLVTITTFFSTCEVHPNQSKKECNMYCLDCSSDQAFCHSCISSAHEDHRVIQIRRSSYQDVVRVGDIQKDLDILGVQSYVINNFRVVFLNERARTQQSKRNNNTNFGRNSKNNSSCEICAKSLADPYCFCSLACKLAWIKESENGNLVLAAKKEEKLREIKEKLEEKDKKSHERNNKRGYQCLAANATPGARPTSRRKGIPHRAPFF